jgi:hypothetical protein
VVVIDEDAELPRRAEPTGSTAGEGETAEGHSVADIGATLQEDEGSHKRRWRLFRKGGD